MSRCWILFHWLWFPIFVTTGGLCLCYAGVFLKIWLDLLLRAALQCHQRRWLSLYVSLLVGLLCILRKVMGLIQCLGSLRIYLFNSKNSCVCGNWFLNLYRSPSCHTLSNGCLMSRNKAEQYIFLSKSVLMSSDILCTRSMVASWFLNSNSWFGIILRYCSSVFLQVLKQSW